MMFAIFACVAIPDGQLQVRAACHACHDAIRPRDFKVGFLRPFSAILRYRWFIQVLITGFDSQSMVSDLGISMGGLHFDRDML